MAEAATQQLEEALGAATASGNTAVIDHIKAALALFNSGGTGGQGAPDDARGEDRSKASAGKSAGAGKGPGKAPRDPRLQAAGSPAKKPGRKPSQSNIKAKKAFDADLESGSPSGFARGKDGHGSPPRSKQVDKGEGIYPALLHSMGGDRKRRITADDSERVPPKRLSSFVNHAVSKGQVPTGVKMGMAPQASQSDREHPGDVPLAGPRVRKAVIRQNSSLGDSVLNHRSLLGTASAGSSGPGYSSQHPGHPGRIASPQHHPDHAPPRRLPFRTATGLQSYQRRPSAGAPADLLHPADLHAAMRAATGSRQHVMGPPPKVMWSGAIKHNASGNMVELCTLMCMLPGEVVDQFPASLFLNELVLRDNVQLGKHVLLNCSMQEPSAEQRQNLAMMSRMKLTGVIRLQHCEVTLCPLVDEGGEIKIMGFLLTT